MSSVSSPTSFQTLKTVPAKPPADQVVNKPLSAKTPKSAKVKKSKRPKTNDKENNGLSADEISKKAKVKNAKQMTFLFNKIKTKIGILEPLTPTWHWVFNVEKNKENTRFVSFMWMAHYLKLFFKDPPSTDTHQLLSSMT